MISIINEGLIESIRKNKPAYLRATGTALGLGGGALLLRSLVHGHQEDFHTDQKEEHEREYKKWKSAGHDDLANYHKRAAEYDEQRAKRSNKIKKQLALGALGAAGGSIGSTLYADIKNKKDREKRLRK